MVDCNEFKEILKKNIINNENTELLYNIKKHPDWVKSLIKHCDYVSLYEVANKSNNHECISILVNNGLGPDDVNSEDCDEWDMWRNSPLKVAFCTMNIEMIEALLKGGFQTGSTSCCPDCAECGWPETCLFEKLFSEERMGKISDENLLRIIRVSNWNHVLSTYERIVNDFLGSKTLNIPLCNRIQCLICKTIPVINLKIGISERNVSHVMDMVYNNIMNIDTLLVSTTKKFLGGSFSSFWEESYEESDVHQLTVEEVKNYLKEMIDYGADTTQSFKMEYACYETGDSVSMVKGRLQVRDEPTRMIPCGSFEDIIRGVFLNKEDTIKGNENDIFGYSREHLDNVFEACEELYNHVQYRKRVGYLRRRVKGFSTDEDPETVSRMFIDMNPGLFSNVMKYIV